MMNILNTANENTDARTSVPSKVDAAELVSISKSCCLAEEKVHDIEENDVDFLEMIESIAEHAVSMF